MKWLAMRLTIKRNRMRTTKTPYRHRAIYGRDRHGVQIMMPQRQPNPAIKSRLESAHGRHGHRAVITTGQNKHPHLVGKTTRRPILQ